MKHAERALIYPVLVALCAATLLRLQPIEADGPLDRSFGVVTAREIRVVGADGVSLVVLSTQQMGGRLAAYGAQGKQVIYLGAGTDSGDGVLIASSKDGARAAELTYGAKGGYATFFADTGKQAVFVGAATDTGTGFLAINRATDGQRQLGAFATEQGAVLSLFGPDGKPVADVQSTGGAGSLALSDGKGGATRLPAAR